MFWLAVSLNVLLSFCFSSSKHNISLLLKYISVEFISIKLPLKNKSKNRKNKKYSLVWKSCSTCCKGIHGHKKMEKLVNVKPQHWHILIIWDKIKAVKTGVTLMSLTISKLRTTVFYFENISFLNRFWIMLCLLW